MSSQMNEENKRWSAKRKSALALWHLLVGGFG